MKILLAYSDYGHNPDRKKRNAYGGVGYYRILKVAEGLKGHEVKVVGRELSVFGKSLEDQWDNIFKEYDVFWTTYFQDDRIAGAMFYHAQKHGKKVIIDCDDNYLDVPESNLLYDTFKAGKKDRAFTSTILSLADVITVSTEPLKERLQTHFQKTQGIYKEIVVIPNMNDIKIWTPVKERDEFVIGYSGSNSHQDDLKMVIPSIVEVMKKYPVRFELIGAIPKDKIRDYLGGIDESILDRVGLIPASTVFEEYPLWLASQGWKVGIAPLVDTAFTRCKSHIKWMEYSSCQIPTVASRVYPYFMPINGVDTIRDNETGMLVRNNGWVNALSELIENEDKRKRLALNAYNYVKENWQYKDDTSVKAIDKLHFK